VGVQRVTICRGIAEANRVIPAETDFAEC